MYCIVYWISCCLLYLIHLGQDKIATISSIVTCIFFNENVWISLKIKFVPMVQINNVPALFQIMAWCQPGDKPLSEPVMISLLTHICITWPRWFLQKLSFVCLYDYCLCHVVNICLYCFFNGRNCDWLYQLFAEKQLYISMIIAQIIHISIDIVATLRILRFLQGNPVWPRLSRTHGISIKIASVYGMKSLNILRDRVGY